MLIEDAPAVARIIQRGLTEHGHQVLVAETGQDALLIVDAEPIDLVVLDIMLPDLDGHQVLAEIRRRSHDLPVLMLTARDDLPSKLRAFDGGAGDYLTKPFDFDELLARIQALSRRAHHQPSVVNYGDLRINLVSHRVWRGGLPVHLSRREFAVLEYFVRNQGRLLSRQQILAAVWEYDFEGGARVVDVYVRYLRAKLDREGEPSLFTTIRGTGYYFDPSA